MIEVFKTSIEDVPTAQRVSTTLNSRYPDYHISFDLEDCDHILRVESSATALEVEGIIRAVRENSVNIEVLPDEMR